MQVSSGDLINVLPSPNFYLDMNAEEVARMSFVPENYKSLVRDRMEWNFGKRDILKNDLVVLDIIAQNNWKRPIYFSGTLAPNSYLNLKEFCQLEGYAYRLMPFKVNGAKDGFVNPQVMEKTSTVCSGEILIMTKCIMIRNLPESANCNCPFCIFKIGRSIGERR